MSVTLSLSLRAALEKISRRGTLTMLHAELDPAQTLSAFMRQFVQDHHRPVLATNLRSHQGWSWLGGFYAGRSTWAASLGTAEDGMLASLRSRLLGPVPGLKLHGSLSADLVDAPNDLRHVPMPRHCERDEAVSLTVTLFCKDRTSGDDLVARVRLLRFADGACALADAPDWLEDQLCAGSKFVLAAGVHHAACLAGEMAHLYPRFSLDQASALAGAVLACAEMSGITVPAEFEYAILCESTGRSSQRLRLGSTSNVYQDVSLFGLKCQKMLQRKHPVHVSQDEAGGARMLAQELAIYQHICQIEGGLDVMDVRCFPSAGGLVCAVKLRGNLRGQAKTGLLGTLSGVTRDVKLAIGVDEDVNLDDPRDIFWSFASRTHAKTDIDWIVNFPTSALDPARDAPTMARWFIDSTMPPLSQPDQRMVFGRATPKNLDKVTLDDFL